MKFSIKLLLIILFASLLFGCNQESKTDITATDILGNPEYLAFSYGGYREYTREVVPTIEELKDDMKILSAMGIKLIRTYNTQQYGPVVIIEVSPKLLKKYSNSDPNFIAEFFTNKHYEVFKITRFSISKIKENDLMSNQPSNWICIPIENTNLSSKINYDLTLRALTPWYLLRKLPSTL